MRRTRARETPQHPAGGHRGQDGQAAGYSAAVESCHSGGHRGQDGQAAGYSAAVESCHSDRGWVLGKDLESSSGSQDGQAAGRLEAVRLPWETAVSWVLPTKLSRVEPQAARQLGEVIRRRGHGRRRRHSTASAFILERASASQDGQQLVLGLSKASFRRNPSLQDGRSSWVHGSAAAESLIQAAIRALDQLVLGCVSKAVIQDDAARDGRQLGIGCATSLAKTPRWPRQLSAVIRKP